MAKVYFGCSMRGGYPNVSLYELSRIVEAIEDLGHVLASKHQTNKKISSDKNKETLIHDRDYEWMRQSDVGVFEISNPSLGTGAEISDMANMRKPVLCLYKRLFDRTASCPANMKRPHRQLCSRFTNTLGSDDSNRFSNFDKPLSCKVSSITFDTKTTQNNDTGRII